MLPDSRTTTYVQGAAPEVQADDLNDLQDNVPDLWQAVRGRDFVLNDDFKGGLSSDWASPGFTGDGTATWVDDYVADGFGAYELEAGSGAGGSSTLLLASHLPIGSRDWRLNCRVRVHSLLGSASVGPGGTRYMFRASNTVGGGLANQWYGYDNADFGPGVAVSSSYQVLEIRSEGGVTAFFVDNVPLWSAPTGSAGALCQPEIQVIGGAGSLASIRVDHFKLWVRK